MFPELAKQLGVPCKLCGKYVIARTEEELEDLEDLKAAGEGNGVKGLNIISGEELKKREPHLDALYAYILLCWNRSPYLYDCSAENALNNGAKVHVNNQVSRYNR
jgi:glycerol-3-phosphate dehydrogenase